MWAGYADTCIKFCRKEAKGGTSSADPDGSADTFGIVPITHYRSRSCLTPQIIACMHENILVVGVVMNIFRGAVFQKITGAKEKITRRDRVTRPYPYILPAPLTRQIDVKLLTQTPSDVHWWSTTCWGKTVLLDPVGAALCEVKPTKRRVSEFQFAIWLSSATLQALARGAFLPAQPDLAGVVASPDADSGASKKTAAAKAKAKPKTKAKSNAKTWTEGYDCDSFKLTPVGSGRIMAYMEDHIRPRFASQYGRGLVDASGDIVNLKVKGQPVNWKKLVCRTPAYFRNKFRGMAGFSDLVFNKFVENCPKPGTSEKKLLTFLQDLNAKQDKL